jgi:hypothetical protein
LSSFIRVSKIPEPLESLVRLLGVSGSLAHVGHSSDGSSAIVIARGYLTILVKEVIAGVL